jgi:hypothetical protein
MHNLYLLTIPEFQRITCPSTQIFCERLGSSKWEIPCETAMELPPSTLSPNEPTFAYLFMHIPSGLLNENECFFGAEASAF